MANMHKRSLPPKVLAMQARKRRRLNHDVLSEKDKQGKKTKANNAHHVVNADVLSWHSVETPDLLDDYEGFFGLEEIDGIDVIRDSSTGAVTYSTSTKKLDSAQTDHQTEDVGASDEWTGFDEEDDGIERSLDAPPKSKPVKGQQPAKKKKRPQINDIEDDQPLQHEAEANLKGAFHHLAEISDGTEIDLSDWSSLHLAPEILAALQHLGFQSPTAIQQASIPHIIEGHDVIGKASTGSGKTLAYGIPIFQALLDLHEARSKAVIKPPLALVLSPTRELAHQIHKHLSALCDDSASYSPSIVTITGGLSLHKQQRQLQHADIIIGTPGRLWELISSLTSFAKSIRHIRYLVIDEADRLLSEGHFKEVSEVLNALDRKDDADGDEETKKDLVKDRSERQSLIFSATFDKGLQKKLNSKARYGGDLMSNEQSMEYLLKKINFREDHPQFIDVDPVHQLATGLKEGLVECSGMEKDLYLYSTLLHHRQLRTLVFTNSISAVRRLAPLLENLQLPVFALHSGMMQKARLRSIERFTKGAKTGSILVATDVAARGLDIPDVQLVIHYHLPRAADVYVHRSGRTARAGNEGSSIIICSPDEVAGVRRLIANVHSRSSASNSASSTGQSFYIRTLDPDRKVIARLKPRVTIAKKLADVVIAKGKTHKEDEFLRAAAEELGVDYDSDEFQKQAKGKHGRGSGRKEKEKRASTMSKAEIGSMRAELKELMRDRVNVGVSEKYITAGLVDVHELLRQQEAGGKTGEFLGSSGGFGMHEE